MKKNFNLIIFIIAVALILIGILFITSDKETEKKDIQPIEVIDPVLSSQSVMNLSYVLTDGTNIVSKNASAVIIKQDDKYYYAVTNYHVLDSQNYLVQSLTLKDYLGNIYQAENLVLNQAQRVISQMYDLGLLRFEKTNVELSLAIIRERPLENFEILSSIGYPDGVKSSRLGEFSGTANVNGYDFPILDHSCMITQGFSGGGLFDKTGRLVGINFAGLFTPQEEFVTAYAIPVSKLIEYIGIFNI